MYSENFKYILEWNVVDCLDYGGHIIVYQGKDGIETTAILENTSIDHINIKNIIYIKYIEAYKGKEVTGDMINQIRNKVETDIKEKIIV